MNGICRDNHFVAQMYFEPWKNNNNKIWTYDLVVPNEKCHLWNEKSIRSIAAQRDWYTRLEEGKEVDDIEKYLNKKIETPASIPLKKAVQCETLTDNDWEKIINYIGCQIVRTPSFASKLTIAAPIPREPPVTITVFDILFTYLFIICYITISCYKNLLS